LEQEFDALQLILKTSQNEVDKKLKPYIDQIKKDENDMNL